ncbi:hypothetical protein F5J12DRAFT_847847 [Pisolithus orientalis]|uniref:uncharacterized protein n=1 Tax=Pisolithus orientalis TaxID=936130 RepID=UPI00222540BA|nr:uncharacterized protein F5J12DRAFT_847847 [Pisolithus orientalis]KAI5999366.1 hypothetical protein F5J12DRAFT_847847 [Pisolithus orientalis]
MNPSLPPPARDPTASIDALRSDANPMTPAAPTPNAFSVLEPSSSSILLPSRPGSEPSESDAANGPSLLDVDPQIIEALKSKDRLYVLKLGEQMECFINDHRTRLDLTPTTSYQRLLVHRCSAYYKLAPETDPINKTISVALTIESRIPTRRIADLVPAPPSHAQPAFKIMQRAATDRPRSKPQSHAGSVIGEEAESSDVEPSEAGSVGGRSNTTGSGKKHMTIAEREAAYNEARSRIFMDFQEKEKVKEKDLSASSSSASLTSGSVTSSVGETSSTGDLEDSISSPATESEWSGPAVRDRKDGRRSNGSSSRSMRSSAPTYGSNSSRESRPPSPPSFRYPSLYGPSLATAPYDQSHHPMHPSAYNNSYMYAYPQPAPPQGCLPYYAPCSYPPPQAPIPTGDPALPSTQADAFGIQQHNNVFIPCGWNYPQQPHPLPHPPAQQQPHQAPGTPIAPPATQYPPYPPVPAYASYSMPVYYTPPPPLPHFSSSPVPQNLPLGPPEYNGAHDTFSPGRPYPGVPGQQSPTMSNKARGAPPARSAWSYGPGVGMGGFGVNNVNGRSVSSSGKDAVGPRLNTSTRRPGNGRSSGFNGTPAGDEAASTASSSTSSSSRRTFNTSTSSQHPLPARPDWAVGLKAQPTLHPTHNRHHDHTVNARTSPVRNNGQRGPPAPPVLQATDFPPLNPVSQTEKRMPPVAGVWNNSSSTRSILMPGNNGLQGSALVNHSANGRVATGNTPACRLEDYDGNWKPGITSSKSPVPQQDKERMRGDAVSSATLAERVMVLSIDDKDGAKPLTPVTLAV